MDKKQIIQTVDHTLLKVGASVKEIEQVCEEGLKSGCASICIPPCFVRRAVHTVGRKMNITTVVGFPNGYNTPASKLFETQEALNNGADEIDMVLNVGKLKEGLFDEVENEIRTIKKACGNRILKVIVEACLLTEEEKINACRILTHAGADYIKTSTGFSANGATAEDVKLFKAHIGTHVKIKAAGGIKTFEQAEDLINAGASRIGSSSLVKLYLGENK